MKVYWIMLLLLALSSTALAGESSAAQVDPVQAKAPPKISSEIAVPEGPHSDTGSGVQLTKQQKQKLDARREERRKQREAMVEKLKKAPPEERAKAREELRKDKENRNQEFQDDSLSPDGKKPALHKQERKDQRTPPKKDKDKEPHKDKSNPKNG